MDKLFEDDGLVGNQGGNCIMEGKRRECLVRWLAIAGLVVLASLMAANSGSGGSCKSSCYTECVYEYELKDEYSIAWWEKVYCKNNLCLWRHNHKVCRTYSVWRVCYEKCYCCVTKQWESRESSRTQEDDKTECKTNILGYKWFPIHITPGQ